MMKSPFHQVKDDERSPSRKKQKEKEIPQACLSCMDEMMPNSSDESSKINFIALLPEDIVDNVLSYILPRELDCSVQHVSKSFR